MSNRTTAHQVSNCVDKDTGFVIPIWSKRHPDYESLRAERMQRKSERSDRFFIEFILNSKLRDKFDLACVNDFVFSSLNTFKSNLLDYLEGDDDACNEIYELVAFHFDELKSDGYVLIGSDDIDSDALFSRLVLIDGDYAFTTDDIANIIKDEHSDDGLKFVSNSLGRIKVDGVDMSNIDLRGAYKDKGESISGHDIQHEIDAKRQRTENAIKAKGKALERFYENYRAGKLDDLLGLEDIDKALFKNTDLVDKRELLVFINDAQHKGAYFISDIDTYQIRQPSSDLVSQTFIRKNDNSFVNFDFIDTSSIAVFDDYIYFCGKLTKLLVADGEHYCSRRIFILENTQDNFERLFAHKSKKHIEYITNIYSGFNDSPLDTDAVICDYCGHTAYVDAHEDVYECPECHQTNQL